MAGSLLVAAVATGLLGWFLSRMDMQSASQWAGIVQSLAAVFTLVGLVFAVMALRTAPGGEPAPRQAVKLGRTTAGKNAKQTIHLDEGTVEVGDLQAQGDTEQNVRFHRDGPPA